MNIYSVLGKRDWKVLGQTTRSQAAEMVIAPNQSEGGPDNRHPDSDQWLFVIDGNGKALFGKRRFALKTGTLLLIEKGEHHEIKNTGNRPLRTLNIYSPPAY